MSKGKIVLVPFPFTDLSGQKVRPCLVLYEQKNGEDCIVSFVSSVRRSKSSVFDISVKASKENGLKIDSIIRMDKIATLQKKIILGELGALESKTLRSVDVALKKIFGLA